MFTRLREKQSPAGSGSNSFIRSVQKTVKSTRTQQYFSLSDVRGSREASNLTSFAESTRPQEAMPTMKPKPLFKLRASKSQEPNHKKSRVPNFLGTTGFIKSKLDLSQTLDFRAKEDGQNLMSKISGLFCGYNT
jgi:hypothetical protein